MKKLVIVFCLGLITLIGCQSKRVVIVDSGKIYATLHLTDFIWGSEKTSKISNAEYWDSNGLKFKNGLKGVVVKEQYHHNIPNTLIYVVKIDGFDDFYIPISTDGVERLD